MSSWVNRISPRPANPTPSWQSRCTRRWNGEVGALKRLLSTSGVRADDPAFGHLIIPSSESQRPGRRYRLRASAGSPS
jgi:hypothetical protein